MTNKKRKEVHLSEGVISELEKQAEHLNRSLKNHMETILINKSKDKPKSFK